MDMHESRFALNPSDIDMPRSKFSRPQSIKTAFNVGELIPFYIDEVLPGDTHKVQTSKVLRMPALLNPVMDDLYLDTYYFFCPSRILWQHWKNLQGENTESAWYPTVEYEVPQVTAPSGGWQIGTIADYMGIPTGVSNISVSALPFRAYAMIVNEWFKDQNLMNPVHIPTDDITVAGSNGSNYISDLVKGGKPFIAAKFHDYFTSCLPSPQKGPDVTLPVAEAQNLPVVPGTAHCNSSLLGNYNGSSPLTATRYTFTGSGSERVWSKDTRQPSSAVSTGMIFGTGYDALSATGADLTQMVVTPDYNSPGYASPVLDNLVAIQNGEVAVTTINQLRTAFQIQKMLEKDARAGTRYREVLKSHFGVTSPDARQQVPEYLGGNRINININQVVQNGATVSTSPLGNVAGYSLTSDNNYDFEKSFTEHGYIIGLMVCRYHHTYSQGIPRFFSRKKRTDFYMPVFANIGEQAILNKEIYAQGDSVVDSDSNIIDNQVFGYQEAWADYRYKPDIVTGNMRSSSSISLDNWHFGDDYSSLPYLSSAWIKEDKGNVDRCLAVSSELSDQLYGDILVDNTTTRIMPVRSIPGLIDHH